MTEISTFRRELDRLGHVEITEANLAVARRVKRDRYTRLRRWRVVAATDPIVTRHGYDALVGRRMLHDVPATERPQIGDVLVRQYAQVG